MFENILALAKRLLSEFINLIDTVLFFFIIMTIMVAFFNMRRHVLISNLILMVVKDVVAGKTDQPLFSLLLGALELFPVLDLVDDSVVNLFELE